MHAENSDGKLSFSCNNPDNQDQDDLEKFSQSFSLDHDSDDSSEDDGEAPLLKMGPRSPAHAQTSSVDSICSKIGSRPGDDEAALRQRIVELTKEVKEYQLKLEILAPIPGLNISTVEALVSGADCNEYDLRNLKIVHQAKLIRQLKRSLLREQQRAITDSNSRNKLMQDNKNLQSELKEALQSKRQSNDRERFDKEAQSRELHSKSTPSTARSHSNRILWRTKYDDLSLRFDKLRSSSKRLQRVFALEVGANVSATLEELLETYEKDKVGAYDSNSLVKGGKRVRAQQVILLKARVKKLEKELASIQNERNDHSHTSNEQALNVDQKVEQELVQHEENKQLQMSRLSAENAQMKERLHRLHEKLQAYKSRTQILEEENKQNKSKLQVLVEKSKNDDVLIDALQTKVRTWKKTLRQLKRAHTADDVGSSESGGTSRAFLPAIRTATNKNVIASVEKNKKKNTITSISASPTTKTFTTEQ